MFSDPATVTLAGVAKTLPRLESNGRRSTYQNADGTLTMTISHSSVGRKTGGQNVRSVVRLDEKAIVTDPLTSENDYEILSTYLVIERPEVGFTVTQVNDLKAALFAFLDSTATTKVVGQES